MSEGEWESERKQDAGRCSELGCEGVTGMVDARSTVNGCHGTWEHGFVDECLVEGGYLIQERCSAFDVDIPMLGEGILIDQLKDLVIRFDSRLCAGSSGTLCETQIAFDL